MFFVQIEIIPCNDKGKEYTDADDMFVEDPQALMGKPVYFAVKIVSARGLPNKFTVSKGDEKGETPIGRKPVRGSLQQLSPDENEWEEVWVNGWAMGGGGGENGVTDG